ncbi:cytochrome c biogenesis protein CcsA [Bacillus andreraoultii]|uniref:cytochrome c biogenesis protein CcsA n=1 Tax=Bacillus andreraoultii TaxID=1499685 RepID=UPI000539C13B|nr:cytochrome c biogenesis protein CcsA [Bacillus andreraoultii]
MGESILLKLHEGMVIFYAASVFLYYFDFLHHNERIKKVAFRLLWIVWLLQTSLFVLTIFELERFPVLTLAEGLYFYSWLLITCSLILNIFMKIEFIVFFTSVLGFAIIIIYTFAPIHWGLPALAQKLASELLFIHITLSFVAYVLFSISFIFSLLYIFQYQLLKKKKWGKWLFRITDLEKIEQLTCRLNIIGIPFIAIGVILGLQWLYLKLPGTSFFDWKIIGSLLVIMMYSTQIYMKTRKIIYGKKFALWNIASFFILLINFFLLSRLSDFHFWLT